MAYYQPRKKRLTSKTHEALVEHFQKRCRERIGYIITQSFLKEEMLANRLGVVRKTSNNRTVFRLYRKYDSDYIVVYDSRRHAFVTIYKASEYHEKGEDIEDGI